MRISPAPTAVGTVTVEYEREQPKDFSGISNDIQNYFKRLALGDIMMYIGRMRKRYGGNLRTPFGEVPLDADIYEEGKDIKSSTIEILERTFLPNVVVDHG